MFQFPTNGKAYPKATLEDAQRIVWNVVSIPYEREGISKEGKNENPFSLSFHRVSIPYEREGISKVFCFLFMCIARYVSFNSLRTGRHIQSCPGEHISNLQ